MEPELEHRVGPTLRQEVGCTFQSVIYCGLPHGAGGISLGRQFSGVAGSSEPSATSKQLENGHSRLVKIKMYASLNFCGVTNHLLA